MINFTFIIPHKNTPDLLQKCLDSIPRRDDVQILVVDDNSDPQMVDFKHFPGCKDSSIEVYFTKEGKGAGFARNVGIERAKGKWIIFADADDKFTCNIGTLLDTLLERTEDVVFFKVSSLNIDDGTVAYRGDVYNRRVDIAIESGDYAPALKYSSPWGKAIRKELLVSNRIKFNEVRCSNDVVFMAKVAVSAQTCHAINLITYCISIRQGSLTATANHSTSLIRMKQDLEGLNIVRKKFQITREDKYWIYYSWLGVYKQNHADAYRLVPQMIQSLGFSFVSDVLHTFYHDLKNGL